MSAPPFTFDWYREFISECKRLGIPRPLSEAESAEKGSILLRHDVDYDLEAASALSRVEEELGVRSSFLFLVSTDFYNVSSAHGRALLRDLIGRGFDAGLHFDPDVHAGESVDDAFNAERSFIESITGRPLRSVSLHNPSAHGLYPRFDGVVNAYDPRWFGEDRYLSDSLRRWRRDPFELLSGDRPDVVQILTHPIHFVGAGEGYGPQFARMTKQWSDRLHRYALRYNAAYRDECG